MTKSDLIKKLSDRANSLNEEDLNKTVNAIIGLISNSLTRGDRVEVRKFGTFSTRSRNQRLSRNPKTGTSVLVDARHHPYFRASKYLKESLDK